MTDQRLKAESVTVSFGGLTALADVTVAVGRGEVVGLIGPNGAGKTTMLNVLSGFASPQAGQVFLGDRDITRRSPRWRARHGISRSFQAARLFERLTVRENIEVGAAGIGHSRRRARRVADELIALLGLGDDAERLAREIPAGRQRQVALARALAGRPELLLLDEPAAGLDDEESQDLVRAIQEIPGAYGCGILVVEHDMAVIMGVCERIQVLDHGRTIAVGDPASIRRDPEVIRAYLGGPLEPVHART
jgi:branched-chain amino acid transport system ATP-binding protein